jgi:hypothetical protein
MVNQRTIDEILSKLEPTQKETIQTLRALIKNSVPETVELVKNGKIIYKMGDKDFVWISQYKDHMDLEFAMGASLASNQLKTRGVTEKNENIRHISISDFDTQKSEVTRLLKEAAAIGSKHCQS